jgi:hypothetical protein
MRQIESPHQWLKATKRFWGSARHYDSPKFSNIIFPPGSSKTTARLCALFKAYTGERVWKAISNKLRRPYYLSKVDHVRKNRDRKQRNDIVKYSFVNRTIRNWNQLPAEALGTFPCKTKIFRKRVRKAIISGVKCKM